jgi:hypothetical protein
MTKNIAIAPMEPLEACQELVQNHGDALRFSISKRGRVWLTFTHWDTNKYNTSVEMDPLAGVQDFLGALAVVCVAHWYKCTGNAPKEDSWHGLEQTTQLVPDCLDKCRSGLFRPQNNDEKKASPTPDQ